MRSEKDVRCVDRSYDSVSIGQEPCEAPCPCHIMSRRRVGLGVRTVIGAVMKTVEKLGASHLVEKTGHLRFITDTKTRDFGVVGRQSEGVDTIRTLSKFWCRCGGRAVLWR